VIAAAHKEEERMHRSRITITAGLVAALSFAGAGCKEEGPAEQAGRAIDEAAESAGEDLMDGPAEEVGEAVDEAAEEIMDAAEDAAD
jgi:hypothetical protein